MVIQKICNYVLGRSDSAEMTSDPQFRRHTRSMTGPPARPVSSPAMQIDSGTAINGQVSSSNPGATSPVPHSNAVKAAELTHLADHNDALRERVNSTELELALKESRLDGLQKELQAEQTRNNTQANQLHSAQTQLQTRDLDIARLNRELHNHRVSANQLQIAKQNAHSSLDAAGEEIRLLKDNLDEFKEQIFRMQPVQCSTDAQIAHKYQNLCESIESWVATTFGDRDDCCVTLWNGRVDGIGPKLITTHLSQREVQLAADCAMIDNNMLANLIIRYIRTGILKPLYPGGSDKTQAMLNSIVEGLRKLNPSRGRSDTIGEKTLADVGQMNRTLTCGELTCIALSRRLGLSRRRGVKQ